MYKSIIIISLTSTRYDYIAIVDTDEVIVPRFPHRNWHDMMANLTSDGKYSYYYFFNYYFFEETLSRKGLYKTIPEHLYMLQNIHRPAEHTACKIWIYKTIKVTFILDDYMKSIQSTEDVNFVGNHIPWRYKHHTSPEFYLPSILLSVVYKDAHN